MPADQSNNASSPNNATPTPQLDSSLITALQNLVVAINGLTQVVANATPSWPPRLP